MSQVTQIRASGDYQRQIYDKTQWSIGYSSILHDALGVFPFKDCFWSNNSEQTGCLSKVCQEPNALLETIVSILSAGPVAPADKIGFVSIANIMQTTRTDGLLLKPDIPAKTMDLVFSLGFQDKPTLLNLTSTYSNHIIQDGQTNPSFNWHYILAADTLDDITITPADLGEKDDGNLFVFDYFQNPTVLSRFGDSTPLVIPALVPSGDTYSFKYYVVFQASSSSYSLVGERNKFAVASKHRFSSISKTTQNGNTITTIKLTGESGEQVTIEMLHSTSRKIESYSCKIGASGTSTLTCTENSISNSCAC